MWLTCHVFLCLHTHGWGLVNWTLECTRPGVEGHSHLHMQSCNWSCALRTRSSSCGGSNVNGRMPSDYPLNEKSNPQILDRSEQAANFHWNKNHAQKCQRLWAISGNVHHIWTFRETPWMYLLIDKILIFYAELKAAAVLHYAEFYVMYKWPSVANSSVLKIYLTTEGSVSGERKRLMATSCKN